MVESIRLLKRREMLALFPGGELYVEKLVVPKSYVARWQIHRGRTVH